MGHKNSFLMGVFNVYQLQKQQIPHPSGRGFAFTPSSIKTLNMIALSFFWCFVGFCSNQKPRGDNAQCIWALI